MNENKKITINEFKMWLQGVEEMQDDDWVPNAIQWKRIREKINNIDNLSSLSNRDDQSAPQRINRPSPPVPPTNIPPGGIPTHIPTHIPQGPPPSALFGSPDGIQAKTPSIDTTDGKYKSAFT